MNLPDRVQVIDSHTEGEPTRVILPGQLALGSGSLAERLHRMRTEHDDLRLALIGEPRGSSVVVGALLLEPEDPRSAAAVIFFNDVGYLGMCGHGTIGVITTLAHLGRIEPGLHTLETPVGTVTACLHPGGSVTVENVPSWRYRHAVPVDVPGYGRFVGDVAWGGNWFFLVGEHPYDLAPSECTNLVDAATAIREALRVEGVTGAAGEEVNHIEFFSEPHDEANSSRNFVLCPGTAFDRSPCGTGTSAKMACLYADGKLASGETWRQEGILGTVFEGSLTESVAGEANGEPGTPPSLRPSIRGRAWITAESTLRFGEDDPFARGIRF